MDKEETKLMTWLINSFKEQAESGGYYSNFYRCIPDALYQCEVRIDRFPNSFTRNPKLEKASISFFTNDDEVFATLQNSYHFDKLAELVLRYIDTEGRYELDFDEDGAPNIAIKKKLNISPISKEPVHSFEDNEGVVLTEIGGAEHSIFGAVAWISNPKIVRKLKEKAESGVIIVFLADKNGPNDSFRQKAEFKELSFPIFYVKEMFGSGNDSDRIMHEKFCVIDNKKVLNGSFNWTEHATRNDETLSIFEDVGSVTKYSAEFKRLWSKYKVHKDFEPEYGRVQAPKKEE